MSDNDLIRRGDALVAVMPDGFCHGQPTTMGASRAAITAIPAVTAPDALHRSFPEAGDGRPLPPMGDELMTAGLSAEDARFVAVQLAQNGWALTPTAVDASQAADAVVNALDGLARLGQEFDAAPDLTDPATVHANMLRGTIAKPTVEQIIHLYGVDALTKALAPVIVRDAAPYMTDLMVDPEEIPDMEMEYDHRAGASDDE